MELTTQNFVSSGLRSQRSHIVEKFCVLTTDFSFTVYAGLVERYATTLRPSAGYRWSADEKYKRVSGKECWLFSVIDTAT